MCSWNRIEICYAPGNSWCSNKGRYAATACSTRPRGSARPTGKPIITAGWKAKSVEMRGQTTNYSTESGSVPVFFVVPYLRRLFLPAPFTKGIGDEVRVEITGIVGNLLICRPPDSPGSGPHARAGVLPPPRCRSRGRSREIRIWRLSRPWPSPLIFSVEL